jgi:glutaredoxin
MGIFGGPKCPYCKGKNLYLKRTSPMEAYGCRDCEEKAEYLLKCGLTKKQIMTLFEKGATK